MKREKQWIVTRVNGRIAAVSSDYRALAEVASALSRLRPEEVDQVTTEKIPTAALVELSRTCAWEDLCLYGTPFQKEVWRKLFDLTHGEEQPRVMSYTEFAALCGNPEGVRAVAHAVACNPVIFIIPCHLIIPKESMDKIALIRADAQATLFKGADLDVLRAVDCGEYAPGKALKREMITLSLRAD
jgi:O-6-methylguanine DNA methyltransferase